MSCRARVADRFKKQSGLTAGANLVPRWDQGRPHTLWNSLDRQPVPTQARSAGTRVAPRASAGSGSICPSRAPKVRGTMRGARELSGPTET